MVDWSAFQVTASTIHPHVNPCYSQMEQNGIQILTKLLMTPD